MQILPEKITLNLASLVFLFINSFNLFAQKDQTRFDSVYTHIASKVYSEDIDKAIRMTDSLSQSSESNLQSMKSILLLALLYEGKGDIVNAISSASKVEKIAIKDKNYEYQVRSAGYLSTLYRRVDLINESNRHILVAEEANKFRKTASNYLAIQSVIHHEKSMHEIDKQNYKQALVELKKSEECLKAMPDTPQNKFSLAAIYESFADCYIELEEFEKARSIAEKGLKLLPDEETLITSLLQNYLGRVEINYKNYDQALAHLQVAEKEAEKSQNLNVQFIIYTSLEKYYLAIDDFEKANHYSQRVTTVNNKRSANIKQISNELLVKLQEKEEKSNKNNQLLLSIVGFLVLTSLASFIFVRRKYKQQTNRYKALINRIESTEAEIIQKSTKKEHPIIPKNGSIMTADTETILLNKLDLLERNNFFLNKNISLSSLATEMNSNTKYVSHLINTHKNKDFNNYINELRILYIVRQFREKPEYSKYKLAFVAEQAGFLSHSRFTSIFKNVTGIAPSVFLAQLKEENKTKV